jgi:hypothetical protein
MKQYKISFGSTVSNINRIIKATIYAFEAKNITRKAIVAFRVILSPASFIF